MDDFTPLVQYILPNLAVWIIHFAIGLLLLIKGGDWFVDGATGIARKFGIPELIIGATVVSIGTTLPEVMVSATAAIGGQGGMAYGNAIGSIICNTALIAALTIAIKPAKVDRKPMIVPVCFFFGSAIFYSLIAILTQKFSRWVGIALLVVFVAYIVTNVLGVIKKPSTEALIEDSDKKSRDAEIEAANKESDANGDEKPVKLWKSLVLLVVGAGVIAVGANFLVHYGTLIAKYFGVPETVIALTFVALGTSLPELVTAVTSLIKGHGSLSLGNIIGANLFNLVLVSGLSTTLRPFDVPAEKTIGALNASFVIDIPVMFAVMLIMTVPTLIRGKLARWQGIVLLAIYAGFCAFQFVA